MQRGTRRQMNRVGWESLASGLALRANTIEQALYAGDYPSWQTGYAGMKILRQCTHVDPILSKVDEFLCRLLNEHAPPDCVSAAFQASHSLRATLQATCTHYTRLHCKFLEWGRDDELPRKVLESVSVLHLFGLSWVAHPLLAHSDHQSGVVHKHTGSERSYTIRHLHHECSSS